MNKQKLLDTYYEASGKLSDISRQLCFAGIAIVWIFKAQGTESAGIAFAEELLIPLGGFVISLGLDLFQYLHQTIAFGMFHRWKEHKKVTTSASFNLPIWVNWPSWFFFYGKVTAVIYSYWILLKYISSKLFI